MKFLPEAELDTVISGHVARHLARVEDGVAGHSQLSVRQGHGHNTSPGRGGVNVQAHRQRQGRGGI